MASRALQIAPRNLSRKPSFIHRVFSSSSTSNDAVNNNSKLASPPSPISFQELEVSPEGKLSFDAIRESLNQRERSFKQQETKERLSFDAIRERFKQQEIKDRLSFDALRKRLKQLQSSSSTEGGQTKGKTEVPSLSASKDSLRLRPVDSDDALPMSVFGKDMRDSLVRSKISEDEKAKKFSIVEEKKQSFEICHNQSKMRDDSYDEKSLKVTSKKQRSSKLESEVWHYLDPLGERPGLFSLPLLRSWSEINAGASKYKVWKVGQSEEHANR